MVSDKSFIVFAQLPYQAFEPGLLGFSNQGFPSARRSACQGYRICPIAGFEIISVALLLG